MNKKRLSIAAAMLFLVQLILPAQGLCEEAAILNPAAKIPSVSFRQVYGIMCMALSIYNLDAVKNRSKEDIVRIYNAIPPDPAARFELNNIDMGKKGWTRYYPFLIGKKYFIARIFLTNERFYQPKAPVLFEAYIANPAVTIQILPGVNEILENCRIRPHAFYPAAQVVETSP